MFGTENYPNDAIDDIEIESEVKESDPPLTERCMSDGGFTIRAFAFNGEDNT